MSYTVPDAVNHQKDCSRSTHGFDANEQADWFYDEEEGLAYQCRAQPCPNRYNNVVSDDVRYDEEWVRPQPNQHPLDVRVPTPEEFHSFEQTPSPEVEPQAGTSTVYRPSISILPENDLPPALATEGRPSNPTRHLSNPSQRPSMADQAGHADVPPPPPAQHTITLADIQAIIQTAVTSAISAQTGMTRSIEKPDKYKGEKGRDVERFIPQCEAYWVAAGITEEKVKVMTAVGRLTEKAAQWAIMITDHMAGHNGNLPDG